ncbi:hypothetical protein EVAR_54891_1 [Eumeta japonica]|uniref:Uncharacterized protein n=1 Tax=Eumeta variegata TaxID=151549 RepID=A0A4C1ZZF1_EUMVA|nr:hypothetical protein EVAR_54891_1 [Eumeta japonica]
MPDEDIPFCLQNATAPPRRRTGLTARAPLEKHSTALLRARGGRKIKFRQRRSLSRRVINGAHLSNLHPDIGQSINQFETRRNCLSAKYVSRAASGATVG